MLPIESERLCLREYTDEDLAPLHAIFSDPEMMQYYPAPFSIEKTRSWIEQNYIRYKSDGFGLWAVCLKETKECIGDCGLIKQTVEGQIEVEIGYHIHKRFWGKGYATEAAMACKSYGFDLLGMNRLISIIDPRNLPSIRVAEKIGFTKEKDAFIFNKHHWIYSGTADRRE